MYIYTNIYIYIYIYIYTHTHTHTYIHIHIYNGILLRGLPHNRRHCNGTKINQISGHSGADKRQ